MKLRSYKLYVQEQMDYIRARNKWFASIEPSIRAYIPEPDTVLMVTDLEGLPGAWPNIVFEEAEQVA